MKRFYLSCLGLTLVLSVAPSTGYAQKEDSPAVGVSKNVTLQGRILRMAGPDQFIVRNREGKEFTFYTGKDTRYLRSDKAIRYSDLRVGSDVTAAYVVQGDRYVVNTVTVGEAVEAVDGPADKALTVRGEISGVKAPDLVTLKTAESKEIGLRVAPTTKIQINGKEAKFTDLRIGMAATAAYSLHEERLLASSINVGGATTAEGTSLEAEVVRVVGEDQIVVRTAAGKEVLMYVNPKTTYQFDDRPGRFTDVRPGTAIRVDYDVRDGRNWGRSILGVRRAK